jgi:hypothetical protein
MSYLELIPMTAPTRDEFIIIWQRYLELLNRLRIVGSPRNGLLAHYTSVPTVEQILRTKQVWLSNPLYMNDMQEMRAGVSLANQKFTDAAKTAGGSDARADILIRAYNSYFSHFDSQTAFDTYIFCLSRQKPDDRDGILSMWREYGSRGNGAAIIFNIQNVNFTPHSPLVVAEVTYATDTERSDQLDQHLAEWVRITLSLNLPDDHLFLAAREAFLFTKIIALTTKHRGFQEEDEVRIIYTPDQDPNGYLKPCLDYHVVPSGVVPKLKYSFGCTYAPTASLETQVLDSQPITNLIEFFLLGPTASSVLAQKSFQRMLERLDMSAFTSRVFASTIPLRPT